jgi:hypothetical protein
MLFAEQSLLFLRTTRNTQIHFVGRMEGFSVLKQLVDFKGLKRKQESAKRPLENMG